MQWNFYNCIGALDGKHIMIRPPPNSGSYYYNYKHHFSIVLMALVDASYRFIYVDIGCNGRVSDGGVFKNSTFYNKIEEKTLNIPQPSLLPGSTINAPYVIVADEAFAMTTYLIKPYGQAQLTKEKRIFNYRLSRARRVVENAFGILATRFRIFMTPIALSPKKVEIITYACCILHNFLRNKSSIYTIAETTDHEDPVTHEVYAGEWRKEAPGTGLKNLDRQGSNNYTASAKQMRENLCYYYNSNAGSVPWQHKMI